MSGPYYWDLNPKLVKRFISSQGQGCSSFRESGEQWTSSPELGNTTTPWSRVAQAQHFGTTKGRSTSSRLPATLRFQGHWLVLSRTKHSQENWNHRPWKSRSTNIYAYTCSLAAWTVLHHEKFCLLRRSTGKSQKVWHDAIQDSVIAFPWVLNRYDQKNTTSSNGRAGFSGGFQKLIHWWLNIPHSRADDNWQDIVLNTDMMTP